MPGTAHADADGDELFDLVVQYHALGAHRTGTDVDVATAAWMSHQLAERACAVTRDQLEFPQWTCTSRLSCDGAPVEHLPVFYEWQGTIETDDVHVVDFDAASGGLPGVVGPAAQHARDAGAAATILATAHPEGSLVAVNRNLASPVSGFPTVLVGGRELDRLRTGRVELTMTAGVEPGTTTNIVARNATASRDQADRPLVLTTPMNGWFGCAGERGSGIAVLLHLVQRLAHLPLVVVATAGHELGYFGGHRWVDQTDTDPAAVVHVGASVAVEDRSLGRPGVLAATRLAMSNLGPDRAQPVAEALAHADLALDAETTSWLGEGEAFVKLGAPLLSFTGAGLDFHTPEDTPGRATSAASLARVANAIGDAADVMWRLLHQQSSPQEDPS